MQRNTATYMAANGRHADAPCRFVFCLVPQFSLASFTNAIEVLRLANRSAGREIYTWETCVAFENTEAIRSSCGLLVTVGGFQPELTRDDTLIVCGGENIRQAINKPMLNWIRREARRNIQLGALCTGAHVLALAGLLDGKRATVHWENQDSFEEEFPDVELSQSVFCIDGKRITAAGGTASIDLVLKLVATDHGTDLANEVADQLIYTSIRTDRDTQRLSTPTRIGVRHPKLSQVIKMMEANLEEPISPNALADYVAMSTRQLERLFRRYLDRSPKRYYMELRLQKARNLLLQTDMSVINVALACGFSSPSHFSKCYRQRYDTTPYRERGAHAAAPH